MSDGGGRGWEVDALGYFLQVVCTNHRCLLLASSSPPQASHLSCLPHFSYVSSRFQPSHSSTSVLSPPPPLRLPATLRLLIIKVKASSYKARYPVLRTVQSPLHFTSLTDLFTQTPSRLLWKASSNMLQLMREDCSYTYPPLSIARYSFIQLSELEQCRVKKLAQGFNTTAQGSNPGSCS